MHAFREEEQEMAFPGAPGVRTCEFLLAKTDPAKEAKLGSLGEAEGANEVARLGGERDL